MRKARHLFAGTPAENAADRGAKLRHAHGSRTGTAILSEAKVVAIKRDRRTQREIAAEHGVSKSAVGKNRQELGARLSWEGELMLPSLPTTFLRGCFASAPPSPAC
jgi:hypothetical protein